MENKKILEIISTQLSKAAEEEKRDGNYTVIISEERIFINTYHASPEDFMKEQQSKDMSGDVYKNEAQMPFRNNIYIIIKFGQGQMNFATKNMEITLQCLSEENHFDVAQAIIRRFINDVNYEWSNGIIQSYFTPTVISASQDVFSGVRALISCRGYIKIPAEGVMTDIDVWVRNTDAKENEGGNDWFRLPFVSVFDNYTGSADPQSFSDKQGRTMALIRQSSSTISINTYMWNYAEQIETGKYSNGIDLSEAEVKWFKQLRYFSINILKAKLKMNRKFDIMIRTNIIVPYDEEPESDYQQLPEIGNEFDEYGHLIKYFPSSMGSYVLVGYNYQQEWGDVTTRTLSFTEARPVEEERLE